MTGSADRSMILLLCLCPDRILILSGSGLNDYNKKGLFFRSPVLFSQETCADLWFSQGRRRQFTDLKRFSKRTRFGLVWKIESTVFSPQNGHLLRQKSSTNVSLPCGFFLEANRFGAKIRHFLYFQTSPYILRQIFLEFAIDPLYLT